MANERERERERESEREVRLKVIYIKLLVRGERESR